MDARRAVGGPGGLEQLPHRSSGSARRRWRSVGSRSNHLWNQETLTPRIARVSVCWHHPVHGPLVGGETGHAHFVASCTQRTTDRFKTPIVRAYPVRPYADASLGPPTSVALPAKTNFLTATRVHPSRAQRAAPRGVGRPGRAARRVRRAASPPAAERGGSGGRAGNRACGRPRECRAPPGTACRRNVTGRAIPHRKNHRRASARGADPPRVRPGCTVPPT